jgi:hypothetical protein
MATAFLNRNPQKTGKALALKHIADAALGASFSGGLHIFVQITETLFTCILQNLTSTPACKKA